MSIKKNTIESFLEVYETLLPLEKTVLQLCSVLYGPTNPDTILKCLLKTGISYEDENGRSLKLTSVLSPLSRLRSMGFLDKMYRCHPGFVEVASRKALAIPAKMVLQAPAEKGKTKAKSARGKDPVPRDNRFCASCGKRIGVAGIKTLKGLVCPACAPKEQYRVAARTAQQPHTEPPFPLEDLHRFGHYGLMVKAVQELLPLRNYFKYSTATAYCWDVFRDLRIAVTIGNTSLYRERMDQLYSRCGGSHTAQHPLISICNNPFDAEWFRTLPPDLQVEALLQIIYYGVTQAIPDADAVAFAMDPAYWSVLPERSKPVLFYLLAYRHILGGRLEVAQRLCHEIEESPYAAGIMGGIYFVQGKNDEAIESFETDLKKLRKLTGRRKTYYKGLLGPLFILALLKRHDPALQKKVEEFIETALSNEDSISFMRSIYGTLKIMAHIQYYEAEVARALFARHQEKGASDVAVLFSSIAAYWLDGELTQERIDAVSRLFINARDVDLKWVAMECAELLCRAEQTTPIRENYIQKVREETGMQSFVSALKVEEAWERNLNALIQVAAQQDRGTPARVAENRLIWLVDYHDGNLSLRPVEQKLTVRGTWSKGRSVALSRLQIGSGLDYITRQDHQIRSTLKRQDYYYSPAYEFDMDKTLPSLVGHPLIFLEKAPSVNVEFVKGEPEVMVERSSQKIRVKLSTPLETGHVVLVRETPTRFKVIELSEEHRRIAKILGERGLSVPESAKEQVLNAVASISSLVTVHSDIGGMSKDIVEVPADPTPHLHLLPAGAGFRLEMFTKPFREGGPHLKPGVGASNVIAEIDGKRMQTKRDLKLEEQMAETVEAECSVFARLPEPDRLWFLEEPDDCLQVLLDLKEMQEKGSVIVDWPEGEKLKVTREVSFDRLRLKIRSRGDWFELSGEVRLDDTLVMDMKQLLELLQDTRKRFIPLGEGQFVALTNEFRKRLEELDSYAEKRGKALRLHPLAALAIEDFTEHLSDLDADKAWKLRLQRIKDAQAFTPVLPTTLKADLRDYQVDGFNWLARLAHLGVGACLADDMGLGKTLQALAIILDRAPEGPTLVVAPTSVCMNWVTEANRFAPTLNLIPFGSVNRAETVNNLKEMDVLVVSYGLLYQEAELLSSVEWRTVVLDEAQAIKNIATKRSQAAMGLKGAFKLITTGTPIENHLGEFYTLFDFINPGLLGSQQRFNARFAVPIEKYKDKDARKRLKKLIQPFILRRIKSQVLEELPPRTEVILRVEMDPKEMAFYEALRLQALERLEKDEGPQGQKHLKILAEIMKLRQACCNARLVIPESKIPSSKLQLFGEVISELLENGHKALVFSQFVGHLNLIRQFLDARQIDYRYLDGSTLPKDRKSEVDAFQAGRGDLFLISLKAGGLGLNLTAADYVIHMDPWWNPAVEDQASDRAHRIGQVNPVTVYRLVTQGTIEEKIVNLHQQKRDLASSLLDGSDLSGKISAEDLLQLIRES